MGGVFTGLNVALSGLYTSQRNLDVVNQNISNANTPGYSRQVVVQDTLEPYFSFSGTGMQGSGSTVVTVKSVRDEYMDHKFWRENTVLGEVEVKCNLTNDLQSMIGEPSDAGFTTCMNEFMDSLQDLKKDPGNPATRTVVKEKGIAFARYFNSLASRYGEMQSTLNQNIKALVNEVNSIAGQILRLNKQISTMELSGHLANELRDKRTVLIDNLSKITDVEVSEISKGMVNGVEDKRLILQIGGKTIVNDDRLTTIEIEQRQVALNEEDAPGLYKLKWSDGDDVTINGGELKGYFDVRDGNNGINGSPDFKGIPYNIRRLDNFVRTYAKAANEGFIDYDRDGIITSDEDVLGHAEGYGVDPDGTGPVNSTTGIRLFTFLNTDGTAVNSEDFIGDAKTTAEINEKYSQINAKYFSISADIIDNYANIATSDKPGEIANNNITQKILTLRDNTRMFAEGAPEDYMKATIISLAIDMQQAERVKDNQSGLLRLTENARLSFSGVSLDEEMTNMVKHQHAYSASARMISTWQDIMDILINRTGV